MKATLFLNGNGIIRQEIPIDADHYEQFAGTMFTKYINENVLPISSPSHIYRVAIDGGGLQSWLFELEVIDESAFAVVKDFKMGQAFRCKRFYPYPKTFMVSVDGTQYEQVVNSPYEEEKMYGAHSGGCAPDEQEPNVSFHQLK